MTKFVSFTIDGSRTQPEVLQAINQHAAQNEDFAFFNQISVAGVQFVSDHDAIEWLKENSDTVGLAKLVRVSNLGKYHVGGFVEDSK